MTNDVLTRLDGAGLGLIVSPPKTATTWLYDVFRSMSDVRIGHSKEIRFLSNPAGRSVAWYQRQFRCTEGTTGPLIDVCHDYFSSPKAPQRAIALDPEVRVVIVLRHPVRRAHSDYLNVLRAGTAGGSIRAVSAQHRGVVNDSRYVAAARRWVDVLGPDRCKFMLFEDIARDPVKVAGEIATHLGIDHPVELTDVVRTRSHAAGASRVPKLTRSFRKVGQALQNRGQHRTVHRLKRSKLLRRSIYRELDPLTAVLNADDADWLQRQLMTQCDELAEVTGLDLSTWTDAPVGGAS